MTSLALLLWIAFGIALQVLLWLGIGFWRHWLEYQALRGTVSQTDQTPQLPETGLLTLTTPPQEAISTPAWTGFRPFRVVRKTIEDDAQSICSFYLAPEDGEALPAFLPGQFLTFRLAVLAAGGGMGESEQIVRCYSLSDAPHPEFYRVSIKRVPAPAGSELPAGRSSNHFHDRIAVGSVLQVRAPSGHFHIDEGHSPVVLIGGGIGITPMLSMLNWSLATQPGREIWLFYGVRNSSETIMKAQLESLAATHPNFHLRLCFSDPLPHDCPGSDYQHRGRVDVALLRAQLPLKPFHFYICGPSPMMESLVTGLDEWGVPDARIHFEAFGPASIKRRAVTTLQSNPESALDSSAEAATKTTTSDIVVTFAKSGKRLPWQASVGSLLEFAEANGVKVDCGCRAGGCGSCQTTIQSGEVAYRQAPDFDPEPGSCLLCICSPKTSVTLEA